MTLNQAYDQLTNSEKRSQLIEAGYKFERCTLCEGVGKINNIYKAVYYNAPGLLENCRKCGGEGGVWIAPVTK